MASRSDSVPRAAHATRRWPVVLVGLALVLGSVACTADDPPVKDDAAPVVQLGAPGEAGKTLSPDEAEAIEEPTWTDADVEFVQGMIPHHQQALEMTALVGDREVEALLLGAVAQGGVVDVESAVQVHRSALSVVGWQQKNLPRNGRFARRRPRSGRRRARQ